MISMMRLVRKIKNAYHLSKAVYFNFINGYPAKKIKIIGVTGTDGKTTTVHLIYEILKKAGKRVSLISSTTIKIAGREYQTDFHVTTPDSGLIQKKIRECVENDQEYLVLEVTSHALDQNRIHGIPFLIAVLTNVSSEHLDYHHNYHSYLSVKLKLLLNSKKAILNCEDKSFTEIRKLSPLAPLSPKGKIITYGLSEGDINLSNFSFKTNLPGAYNQYNCLAAAAVAGEIGIDRKTIQKAISSFKGVIGRFDLVANKRKIRVIIDFAHTPNALLQLLKEVKKTTSGKIIHVFGCAGLRDSLKRIKMGQISAQFSNISIVTEEDYRTEKIAQINKSIISGFKDEEKKSQKKHQYYVIDNRSEAIEKALNLAKKGDTVLLTGKGHERSLCRGKVEYPWNEHQAVSLALKKLG